MTWGAVPSCGSIWWGEGSDKAHIQCDGMRDATHLFTSFLPGPACIMVMQPHVRQDPSRQAGIISRQAKARPPSGGGSPFSRPQLATPTLFQGNRVSGASVPHLSTLPVLLFTSLVPILAAAAAAVAAATEATAAGAGAGASFGVPFSPEERLLCVASSPLAFGVFLFTLRVREPY
jgi:hypothetical protein